MPAKINKVERISLSGGLLGLLFTNPRRALETNVLRHNAEGWSVRQVLEHTDTNLAAFFLRILVLMLTLFLWTWGAGYIIIYEKDR
jgi:hypothetical protein